MKIQNDLRAKVLISLTALALFSALVAAPISAQPAREVSLALATIRSTSDYAKAALASGGPFLIDSSSWRAAMPDVSQDAVLAAFDQRATLTSPDSATSCIEGPRRCSIKDRGVLTKFISVASAKDSASATVDILWTSESSPRDETVVGVRVRFEFVWRGGLWALDRTVPIYAY